MLKRNIIILGALSAIAEETARLYAAKGANLVLAGRNEERLNQLAADLKIRGAAQCDVVAMDLSHEELVASTFAEMTSALNGKADGVYLFYGLLGDQRQEEGDITAALRNINVNFTSAAAWCLAAANQLERQASGVLIAVSSVAGDRGRQSNYIYGAGKAGLTVLVQGIAHRLAPKGARAVVAKLGFVDTPMTAHIAKKGLLWAKPAAVAARLVAAAEKPSLPVVYVPGFWRVIMTIICIVPAKIFHKTKL